MPTNDDERDRAEERENARALEDERPTFDDLAADAAALPLMPDGSIDGRTPCPVCGQPADAFEADDTGRIIGVHPCGHNPSEAADDVGARD